MGRIFCVCAAAANVNRTHRNSLNINKIPCRQFSAIAGKGSAGSSLWKPGVPTRPFVSSNFRIQTVWPATPALGSCGLISHSRPRRGSKKLKGFLFPNQQLVVSNDKTATISLQSQFSLSLSLSLKIKKGRRLRRSNLALHLKAAC